MKQAKLESLTRLVGWDLNYTEYGQVATAEWRRESKPPTALFAGNDEIAL